MKIAPKILVHRQQVNMDYVKGQINIVLDISKFVAGFVNV